jgi:hypothetical protein
VIKLSEEGVAVRVTTAFPLHAAIASSTEISGTASSLEIEPRMQRIVVRLGLREKRKTRKDL